MWVKIYLPLQTYSGPLSARQGSWQADNGPLYVCVDLCRMLTGYIRREKKMNW